MRIDAKSIEERRINLKGTLEFRNITKDFPGVKALNNVSFKISSGEVVAMVGENGAGKSTLLKILNGDYIPTSGQYLIDGKECHFQQPQDAIHEGVGVIYQERQIIPYLSVAENIYMEDMPTNRLGIVDFKALNRNTQKILDEFKLPFHPTDRVQDLSVAYQQMVEIMKAYRRHPKILAFDEPTASLSDTEIDTLFSIIRKLKKEGIMILYVSHRMKEIFQITDRMIIMKDGNYVKTLKTDETNEKEIIKLMVGRDLGDIYSTLQRNDKIGAVVLKVEHLSNEFVKDVSFSVRAGEILGLAGLVGAGRTEVIRSVYGADPIKAGKMFFNDKEFKPRTPADAISKGVMMCPEDRKYEGIIGNSSVRDNISISVLKSLCKAGFIEKEREEKLAFEGVEEFNVKTPGIKKRVGELSGGNQQKVLLARSIATKPKLLILDEPTKGIDVGAKTEIYKMVCQMARKGIAVILISSELTELLGLCDRIVVMCQGRVTGEMKREEATDEKILTLAMKDMLGGQNNDKEK